MHWLGELWRRLLFLLRRRQFDRDLEEEMRFHLEMKARDYCSADTPRIVPAAGGPGTTPPCIDTSVCATAAARRSFGNMALMQEDSRGAWGWSGVEAWLADLRYALRALRKNPGFTAVAVLTMALGIGASTAMFSVVHAVVLRPLPFRDPGRLAVIWETREKNRQQRMVASWEIFREWKQQAQSFEQMAAWDGDSVQMTVGGEPVEIPGARVSAGFFEALGVQPIVGRVFAAEEQRQSGGDVTILSYDLWQRLGGDRNIAGKKMQFDRKTLTVAGVMPRGFAFPSGWSELWMPHAVDDPRNRGAHYLKVIARLKPAIAVSQAQSEMRTIAARLKEAHDGIGANVVTLEEEIAGEARRVLPILMGAVGCVFLIACANVANLLLVRAIGRRRELALRLALGAGRWRVARCLITESVLLALAGGAIGIAAAYWVVRVFVALDPIHLPRVHEIAVNGIVLGYAVLLAVATGMLFGLAPAFRASAPDLANWLKEGPGAPGAGGFRQNRGRNVLAAAQVALAVMLLVGAGLLLRSFVARVSVPLGFRPEGALGIDLPWSANRRIDELTATLRALPGVTAAGASTAFPQNAPFLSCDGCIEIEGQVRREGKPDETGLIVATPGYFEAAGMRLRRGRFFMQADGKDAPKVAVINEAMAQRDFDGQDPVGRHVRWGNGNWATVAGVAENVKGFSIAGDPGAAIYFPNRQAGWYNPVQVLVRTAVPPASLAGAVRRKIREWNPRIVIKKLDTVDNMLAASVAAPRFYLMLVAGFAVLALVVSAVGVYGSVNYSVSRRTHEIGIRMALGAARRDVLAMVLGQGLWLAAAGVALGLAGAWITTRVLETLLFGVRATDGASFACGAGILVLAVLLACYVPARRATRVDPLEALRHE